MKKTTLVIVGLFAAVLAYYLLFEKKAKVGAEAAHEAKRILSFDASQVEAMTIERPYGSVKVEATADRKWRMTQPMRTRADRWACDAVASALADMERQREVENTKGKAGLAEMGLDPPRVRVELTLGPKPVQKDSAPVASGSTAGKALKSSETTPEATAQKTATGSAAVAASSSTARASGAQTASAGPTSTRVIEVGNDVPATSSVFVRVDGQQAIQLVPESSINALLKPLLDFRDHSLLDVMILDVGEARITRPEGDLRFRRHDEDWWIESPMSDLADGSTVQNLLSAVVGLRAESFLDEPPGLSEIVPPAANMGSGSVTPSTTGAEKARATGSATEGRTSNATASSSADETRRAPNASSAAGAGASSASAASADRGLDPPHSSICLFDKSEREIATVSLGSPVPGQTDKVYARVRMTDGSTTNAVVANGGLTSISGAAPTFRSHKALAIKTWEASSLEIKAPGSTLSLVKKDAVWSATTPATLKVDANAIEDTLQALADLEISTFETPPGSTPSSLGLEPAAISVTVGSETAGSGLKTLVLGHAAPGSNAIYARALGRPGFFTVPSTILDRIKGGAALYAVKAAPEAAPITPPAATPKAATTH